MNLYRSFGNLMEVWVAEESQGSDSDVAGNNEDSPAPSPDTGTNWCESQDSGVEAGGSDTSCPAMSCSTDNAETDSFMPERDSDELTAASTSQSLFLSSPAPSSSSSSSPRLCHSRAQGGSAALNHKVEQALKRINSTSLKATPEPLTGDELLWRQPCPSLLPKRHSSELLRGQRLQRFHPRCTVDPSLSIRHMSEKWRRKLSVSGDQPGSEDVFEDKREQLSPGLIYLEQVCQMLEEIARQQMQNRASQTETAVLQEHRDTEDVQTWSDAEDTEEKPSSCQRLENPTNTEHSSAEAPLLKNPFRHFRARSASDTSIATLHKRKLNADCRGQHLSTCVLNLEAEGDGKKLESIVEETDKPKKNWKFRIGSLRRDVSTKSQQMQPPEKNSTGRRLSQLFRRKRTILPE